MRAFELAARDVPGDHGVGVLHPRDGAEHEHVDGLAWVMHAEGADGLQRGGVVVGEVGDETFGEETRADRTAHELGAVLVETGSRPVAAIAPRVDAVLDDLQLGGVDALRLERRADNVGTRRVLAAEDLEVLGGEPRLFLENS